MIWQKLMGTSHLTLPTIESSAQTINSTTGTTLTINAPSAVEEGDLLFAFLLASSSASGAGYSTLSGWTNRTDGATAGAYLSLQSKVAGSSEPANYTFTTSSTASRSGIILHIKNGAVGAIGGQQSTSSGTSGVVANSITVPDSGSLLLALYWFGGLTSSTTNPGTPTDFALVDRIGVSSTRPAISIFQKSSVFSGSSGSVTSTWNLAVTRYGVLISISPA
jgi:hypothetical protein